MAFFYAKKYKKNIFSSKSKINKKVLLQKQTLIILLKINYLY